MTTMAFQITDVSVFAELLVQAEIKEKIKTSRHWSLWGESIGDLWCFLRSAPEQTIGHTIETPVI